MHKLYANYEDMATNQLFRVSYRRIKQYCVFLCTLFACWLAGRLGKRLDDQDSTLLPKGWLMFNPALAAEIGINKAVIDQGIDGWVQHNRRHNKNIKGGRAWSYNTIPDWGKVFCWLNANYVGKLIRELEGEGRLLSAKLAPHPSDQTKYYSTAAGALPDADPQQMSLWPVENMILGGRKAPHDSSIGTAKANPSKAKSKTPTPTARVRANKPMNAGGVALFPNHIPDVEPPEKKNEIPEHRPESEDIDSATAIDGKLDTATVEYTPFVPRVSPCPTGDEPTDQDESTESETASSGATPEIDVPEWINIFTTRDSEINGWLKTDADRLKAWCEYAPDHNLGGGFVRQRLRESGCWPPQQKANDGWSNLTAAQRAEIERNNEEAYQELVVRRGQGAT